MMVKMQQFRLQAELVPARVTLLAKKNSPLVIIDTMYFPSQAIEMCTHFRTN
jgi:hypothetical protein